VRIDVVFDKDGNAVQRPAPPAGFALAIHFGRNCQCIRIDFDHGIDRGASFVYLINAFKIFFHD